MEERKIIDNVEALKEALVRVKKAQKEYATYTQEQVDKIFKAAAIAANQARIPLAKLAVEETGMGVLKIRLLRTTLLLNIFTINIKMIRHVILSKKIKASA